MRTTVMLLSLLLFVLPKSSISRSHGKRIPPCRLRKPRELGLAEPFAAERSLNAPLQRPNRGPPIYTAADKLETILASCEAPPKLQPPPIDLAKLKHDILDLADFFGIKSITMQDMAHRPGGASVLVLHCKLRALYTGLKLLDKVDDEARLKCADTKRRDYEKVMEAFEQKHRRIKMIVMKIIQDIKKLNAD